MKKAHNIKPGETMQFANLGEVQNWAEQHEYKSDEFECVSADPFTYKKVN